MTQSKQEEASFSLERMYIKDISYESPNSPQVFSEQSVPAINIQLNIAHRVLNAEEGYYEVVLSVNVTAKVEEKTIFLVEVEQAGIFLLKGIPAGELDKILEVACPNILLPFAREAINDLVCKGGFPQLLINPVNFEVLYQQKRAAKTEKQVQH